MNYSEKLATLKLNPDVLLREIGDEWRTPDDLFLGINQLYGPFVLDLFTDGDNAKCATYYTAQDNALAQPWAEFLDGGIAFANPPYSRSSYDQSGQPTTGMRHIVAKAMEERDKGARVVFLIKAAPSESWWPEHADHVCWIKGRVGFELPLWAQHLKASSAGFGQAVVVFDKNWRGERERYIARDVLERQGLQVMADIEQRAERLAAAMVAAQAPAIPSKLTPLSSELEPLSSELAEAVVPAGTLTDEGTIEKCLGTELAEFLTGSPKEEEQLALEPLSDQAETCSLVVLHNRYLNGELTTSSWEFSLATLIVVYGDQEQYPQAAIDDVLSMKNFSVFTTAEHGLTNEQHKIMASAGLDAQEASKANGSDNLAAQLAAIRKAIKVEITGINADCEDPEPLPPEPELDVEPEPQTDFTPEDLHRLYASKELSADSITGLMAFLVGMFGARATYHIKQVQIASVAESGSSIAIEGLDRRQQSLFATIGRALAFNDVEVPSQQVAAAAHIIELDAAHQIANDTERQLGHREIQRALQPFTTKTVEFAS